VNLVGSWLRWFDRFQRRHRLSAFALAVQKKYSDDRGGHLAALITYYAFLSIFPLLLAFFTIASYLLAGHGLLLHTLDRHLGSYPVLGPAIAQLEGNHLQGSIAAVVVGVIGLVWGAMGLSQTLQHCMDEAWNVPGKDRAGFVPRLLRGLTWYLVFGVGFVASALVSSLGSVLGWAAGPVLSSLPALVINVALFAASFRVLSPPHLGLPQLWRGALFSGTLWTVLTSVGIGLSRHLSHSNALYGSFAPVLGLIAFLYLAARLSLYGVEADVVRARHLWPRSLLDSTAGTADRQELIDLARREERAKTQTVRVEF